MATGDWIGWLNSDDYYLPGAFGALAAAAASHPDARWIDKLRRARVDLVFNLCESMNNSFRFVCAGGVQQYKTFLRRGLKYSWMTLRDFREPVRVRHVRVIMNTYPPTGAGAFECSDERLSKIWKVGVYSVRNSLFDVLTAIARDGLLGGPDLERGVARRNRQFHLRHGEPPPGTHHSSPARRTRSGGRGT